MEYTVTPKQIDKLMKSYWDSHFEGAERVTRKNKDGDRWTGLWKGNHLIIGHPELDDSGVWFYDGRHFRNHRHMFNLEQTDYDDSMKRYLGKNFDLRILRIM